MHTSFHHITDQFLADKMYHRTWNERIRNRLLRLPNLVIDINDFAAGKISLESFRTSRLQHDLPQQAWDSSNQKNSREWLLAELTTLCRYNSRSAEQALHDALRGLNRANVGQRIEQLHDFLTADQAEFRRLKRRSAGGLGRRSTPPSWSRSSPRCWILRSTSAMSTCGAASRA